MKKSSVFDTSTAALKQIVSRRKEGASSTTNEVDAASPSESLEQKLNVAQTQLQHLQHDIAQLQRETDIDHQQVDQVKKELHIAQEEQQRIEKQKLETQQDLQRATIENINKLSQKISNKQNDILIGRQRIGELKNAADDQERSTEDKAQIKRLEEQQQALEETKADVQKSVAGANKVVQRGVEAVKEAKIAISNASEQGVQAAREEYQQKQIDLNTARYHLRGAERQLADINEDLSEVQNQAGLLQGNVHEILNATKAKLAKDEQLLVTYQEQLSTLQSANGRMQSLKAALRWAEEGVRQTSQKQAHLQQILAEKINQLTNAKRKALDCQQEIEKLQQQLQQQTRQVVADQAKQVENQRLPQVGVKERRRSVTHPSLLKVAALTVSEILTRLDFGHHKNSKK